MFILRLFLRPRLSRGHGRHGRRGGGGGQAFNGFQQWRHTRSFLVLRHSWLTRPFSQFIGQRLFGIPNFPKLPGALSME